MTFSTSNPALDAELAYRREQIQQLGRTSRTRRGPWMRLRRRSR